MPAGEVDWIHVHEFHFEKVNLRIACRTSCRMIIGSEPMVMSESTQKIGITEESVNRLQNDSFLNDAHKIIVTCLVTHLYFGHCAPMIKPVTITTGW